MKLFHTENGKEVVYVQMIDIMYTESKTSMPIPAFFYQKVLKGVTYVNESNRFNFIRFDEKEEVDFFKQIDFIINYDDYKNFTDENFEERELELINKMNEIADKLNDMSQEEQAVNASIIEEWENLEYMLKFLYEIYDMKHRKKVMPFPEFVDKI